MVQINNELPDVSSIVTNVMVTNATRSTMMKSSKDSQGTTGSSINVLSMPASTSIRSIRSFTLFDNRDFLPRPFQIELYEACKFRDTIIFLRPGNGKHFLSLMLVKHFSPKVPPDGHDCSRLLTLDSFQEHCHCRRIFFIAKSVQSIRQYASVFYAHTDLRLAEYLESSTEVNNIATNLSEWLTRFKQADLHLMLDSLFEELVKRNYIKATQIELLIMDDVHQILLNTSADHVDCYARIIQLLKQQQQHHSINEMSEQKMSFRILGLSASILLEGISANICESMIKRIEQALSGCRCETYADLRMISKYSIQCRINVRRFPIYMPSIGKEVEDIFRMSMYQIRQIVPDLYYSLSYLGMKEKDILISYEMLMQTLLDVLYVYGTLGEWCAFHLIEFLSWELCRTLTLLKKTQSGYLKQLNAVYTVLQVIKQAILEYLPPAMVAKLLEAVELRLSDPSGATVPESCRLSLEEVLSISSPKLHLLARLLNDYLAELMSAMPNQFSGQSINFSATFQFPANICAILYAENRSVVRMLSMWLQEVAYLCSINNNDQRKKSTISLSYIQPDYVFLRDDIQAMETRNIYYDQQQKSLHEIHFYRRQEEVLKRFRFANECNFLVTTSMTADGLDVNRCNLVIAFDPPKTFQQFIKTKGRVRVERGQFVVLVPNQLQYSTQEVIQSPQHVLERLKQFCEIEKIFTKLVPTNNDIQFEEADQGVWKGLTFSELARVPDRLLASIEEAANNVTNKRGRGRGRAPQVVVASSKQAEKKEEELGDKVLNTPNLSTPPTATASAGGLELSLDNAISILNRYCLKLPSDTFTKMTPNFKMEHIANEESQSEERKLYQCRLYLPINSTFRDEIVGDIKDSEAHAKQSVAYRAVLALRDIGELDANFYPVGKETNRYIETLGLQECFLPAAISVQSSTGRGRFATRSSRLQARNIASKRRQYYHKKVSEALQGNCFTITTNGDEKQLYIRHLYEFHMKLTCPIPEEQNTRGRRVVDPAQSSRTLGVIVPNYLPPICDFTIYNRSGEVMVSLKRVIEDHINSKEEGQTLPQIEISPKQMEMAQKFHHFIFENVLRLGGKTGMEFDLNNSSNGNYLVVPIDNEETTGDRSIDWKFVESIVNYIETFDPVKLQPQPGEVFSFEEKRYFDAVVIPRYRRDKQQSFFYVAEICHQLTPLCSFPDEGFETFEEYYRLKYDETITNLQQPLLDVDHTSSRLNYLTPRYLNRKGMALPVSSAETRQLKRQSLQQKQILVPELCYIHPFPASFWRKIVCLPTILFRMNSLLVAEELRQKIALEAKLGQAQLPAQLNWPNLDFGWSKMIRKAIEEKKTKEANQQLITEEVSKKIIPKQNTEKSTVNKKISIETEANTSTVLPDPNDPFASMGDWTTFLDNFDPLKDMDPLCPGLAHQKQDTPISQIEILASGPFSSSSFSSSKVPPFFDSASPRSSEPIPIDDFLKLDVNSEDEEVSNIVEIDEEGKTISSANSRMVDDAYGGGTSPPIRYGSPTQFNHSDDEEDEMDTFNQCNGEVSYISEDFQRLKAIDWLADNDNESQEQAEAKTIRNKFVLPEGNLPIPEYVLDMKKLCQEFSSIDLTKLDDDFDDEPVDYEDDENSDSDTFDDSMSQQVYSVEEYMRMKKEKAEGKKARQAKLEIESYSDFELEEDDDEEGAEEYFSEEGEEDIDDDDDDDEEDLDDGYEDDEDHCFKRKTARRKKGVKSLKDKTAQEEETQPTLDGEESGKSFIYDCLKFELLYDVEKFEEYLMKCQHFYRKLVGEKEEFEKEIRSKRKLFEKIYQCEKRQVLQAVINMKTGLGIDNPNDELMGGCETIVVVDKDSKSLIIEGRSILELLFETFHEDMLFELSIGNHMADPLEEIEEIESNELNSKEAESLDYIIQYYNASRGDEVKFGELLPNRDHSNGISTANQMEQFSFDRSASSARVYGRLLGPDPSLILQAITMSNSSDGMNLERLETVGDSFLKYSITVFLYTMCPDLNEGKLSFLRSRQISNINLHRLGQRIQLGQLMNATKFEPNDNWCPPGYKVLDEVTSMSRETKLTKVPNLLTQHSIPNKSIADCVEALIGAYLIAAGQMGAIKFMDWLGLKVISKGQQQPMSISSFPSLLTKENNSNMPKEEEERWLVQPKSPLILPQNVVCNVKSVFNQLDQLYTTHRLSMFEKQLGYRFRDRAYLVQAFTHNSFYENKVTDCYQRLEFLGDAVLDYLITRYLFEDPRGHSPGTLTDLRSALVNNTFFASLAVKYNFHKYLLMLSNELYRVIDGFVRKFNLYNLTHARRRQQNQQSRSDEKQPKEGEEEEKGEVEEGEEEEDKLCSYWELFISENEAENLEDIEVPKALGDIFESVAGAIYLDSGMSLDAVWKVYHPMMKPEIEYFSYNVPKSPIRVLLEKCPSKVKFGKPEITSGRKVRVCVEVFNLGKFVGVGRNKRIAKCTAAKRALRAQKVVERNRKDKFQRQFEMVASQLEL